MVSWFSKMIPRQFSGRRIIFSTDGPGSTGYPHTKEWNWFPISQCIQKLTQNGRAKTKKLLEKNKSKSS